MNNAPREYSPGACIDQYPNMHSKPSPTTFNVEYSFSHFPASMVCASPAREPSNKRQRVNGNRIFEYKHRMQLFKRSNDVSWCQEKDIFLVQNSRR